MNSRVVTPWASLLLLCPNLAVAQSVVIRGGAPAAVVDLLRADLQLQGFKFVSADEKGALLTLDRGVVVQEGGRGTSHVILELRVEFKTKPQGLEVTAYEEVTDVLFPSSRKTVRSLAERNNLQRLLDSIRTALEAKSAPRDSTVKRDSNGPADFTLSTGTRARFWSHTIAPGQWHVGVLARLLPPGQVCLGVVSDELGGITVLSAIDSLQIDRSGWRDTGDGSVR